MKKSCVIKYALSLKKYPRAVGAAAVAMARSVRVMAATVSLADVQHPLTSPTRRVPLLKTAEKLPIQGALIPTIPVALLSTGATGEGGKGPPVPPFLLSLLPPSSAVYPSFL